jgi:hypothetical protein
MCSFVTQHTVSSWGSMQLACWLRECLPPDSILENLAVHPAGLTTANQDPRILLLHLWDSLRVNETDVLIETNALTMANAHFAHSISRIHQFLGCKIYLHKAENILSSPVTSKLSKKKLSGQIDDKQSIFRSHRKYTSVDITYIIKHFTNIKQILTFSTLWSIATPYKNRL